MTIWQLYFPPSPLTGMSLIGTWLLNIFLSATHSLTFPGLPAQAKKHAESAKNILLAWRGNMSSDKEKKEILEALIMLYYTLGVVWLLQNQYPFIFRWVWWSGPQGMPARRVIMGGWEVNPSPCSCILASRPSTRCLSLPRKVGVFLPWVEPWEGSH